MRFECRRDSQNGRPKCIDSVRNSNRVLFILRQIPEERRALISQTFRGAPRNPLEDLINQLDLGTKTRNQMAVELVERK